MTSVEHNKLECQKDVLMSKRPYRLIWYFFYKLNEHFM